MREVRAPGREVHPEKAGHHVCLIDRVTLTSSWADQQLVQNRRRMTFDSLLFHVLQIDDSGMRRDRSERDAGRDLEAHNQDLLSLADQGDPKAAKALETMAHF